MNLRRWLLGGAVLIPVALFLYLGFWPVPPDVPTGQPLRGFEYLKDCTPKREAVAALPRTLRVEPGESIQDAVRRARAGDTVLVSPGVYHESVVIEINNLTLRGSDQDMNRAVLDGENRLEDGVIACGDGFTMVGFEVRNYIWNGVQVLGADGVTLRDIFTDHTGRYGLYAVRSSNVLIERCVATGVSDTGIYVGESRDSVVRDSEAYGNLFGFVIANSTNDHIVNNHVHDNTDGILVLLMHSKTVKEGGNTLIENNRVISNNLPKFGHADAFIQNVPAGTGILIIAADATEVTGNEIRNNHSAGVAVISLRQIFPKRPDFDVGTEPERTWVHDNLYENNGTDPDPLVEAAGLRGADLLWDASAWDNAWSEGTATRFPPLLPGGNWPGFLQRAWWRILVFGWEIL